MFYFFLTILNILRKPQELLDTTTELSIPKQRRYFWKFLGATTVLSHSCSVFVCLVPQFAGFSSDSLCERIIDAQSCVLVTAGRFGSRHTHTRRCVMWTLFCKLWLSRFLDLIICPPHPSKHLSIHLSTRTPPQPLSLLQSESYRWCLSRREADQPQTDCKWGPWEVQAKVSSARFHNCPYLHTLLVMGLWHMSHWTHAGGMSLSAVVRIHTGWFAHYRVSRQHKRLRFMRVGDVSLRRWGC